MKTRLVALFLRKNYWILKLALFYRGVKLRRQNKDYFEINADNKSLVFIHLSRSWIRYSHGLNSIYERLLEGYCLKDLKLSKGDTVLDIGANIGEFSLALFERYDDLNLVCIEPSPIEFEVLTINMKTVENCTLHNIGLWNEFGSLPFYLKSETADNSFFEPEGYTNKVLVDLVTLDSLTSELTRIKLIKLEAEGAEPEILRGALSTIQRTEYISVDGGPERGLKKSLTLPIVCNMLAENGFAMHGLNLNRGTALFKNKRL